MSKTPENQKRPALRPDTLLGSVAILLLVNVVQRSVGFGRGVLFCRWLDAEALGLWEMAFGFLLLAAPVAVLGLPGSFGRYLTRYREQGRLRMFLRRTAAWTFGLGAAAVGVMVWRAGAFATLVFGDADQAPLMVLVTACLAAMITHHFLEAVFSGLRLFRIVSIMHFGQSMAFAAIGLTLIACWRADASSVVVGYGAACGLSVAGVLAWAVFMAPRGGDARPAPRHREFWPVLMRFAIWVWVTNLLANLFTTIDRYMILHYGGYEADVALQMVGNYHTSSIVPVLLISVANLLGGAITPHLSHDWEAGHRDDVSRRLNLTIKLAAVAMLAGGVGVLVLCPLLFQTAFEGKYDDGLAVLPLTLTSCVFYSLVLITQTYVWCAEKSRGAAIPLLFGLLANVLLNLVLLPLWGLQGAVAATVAATVITLALQFWINHRQGMHVPPGTLLLSAAPLLLAFGPVPAAAGLAVIGWLSFASDRLLDADEQNEITSRVRAAARRIVAPGDRDAKPQPQATP